MRFQAIRTTIEVVIDQPDALEQAAELVRAQVATLDAAAADSERTRADSAQCLTRSTRSKMSWPLFRDHRGIPSGRADRRWIVDPTIGHALELYGYGSDFSEVPSDRPALKVPLPACPRWRRVGIDRAQRSMTLPAGVRIDLGATAKADCADRTARSAATASRNSVLVDLSGDLAVAGPPPPDGWIVRLADDHDTPAEEPGVTIANRMAGSPRRRTAARRWSRSGQTMQHLIDPAAGHRRSLAQRTVSVATTSSLEADIASTASVSSTPRPHSG